jgi:hypothetical protein
VTDEEIIDALRSKSARISPVELINGLMELDGKRLSQFRMIALFKRAFPQIPLRILNEASTSRLLNEGGMCDEDLTELLKPWFRA